MLTSTISHWNVIWCLNTLSMLRRLYAIRANTFSRWIWMRLAKGFA